MSNYRRWRVEGGAYFFTLVTQQRRRVLTDDASRIAIRNALRSVRARLPFRIIAIALLPDHLHTIWELPPGDSDYSTRIRQVKALTTRALGRQATATRVSSSRHSRGEQGFWQRRFYERTCRDEVQLKKLADYIHVNPLKHKLVERVRDWPWSSFHRFVKLGEYEHDWGNADEWYGDEFESLE
jgi:putative transposase